MSTFYLGKTRLLMDELTPERLVERVPRYGLYLEGVRAVREAKAEAARVKMNSTATGMTRDGTMQHVASIPFSLMAATLEAGDHETFLNRDKFYAWLARHPEWRVGRTIIRAR